MLVYLRPPVGSGKDMLAVTVVAAVEVEVEAAVEVAVEVEVEAAVVVAVEVACTRSRVDCG